MAVPFIEQVLRRVFPGAFASLHTVVLDTTVPENPAWTLVLAANPDRKYAAFSNDSAVVMYMAKGAPPAGVTDGVRLNPLGGAREINSTNLYLGAIYAGHAGVGPQNLCVEEGT